jgi:energy-coupling factor transporter ATP-binding protein EcfA2
MKLKRLKIKGFKNLTGDDGWFNLDFTNKDGITVLIGNNGSGKSNVIEAISSIFSALYKKTLNRLTFQFDLYYSIGRNKYRISKKIKVRYRRCLNNNTTYSEISQEVFYSERNNPNAVQFVSLPNQIIALYSGEESRLWEKYYKDFYIKYNSDVISSRINIDNDPKMLYINKYYWDIALLTMIASDVDLKHIIGNIKIDNIEIKINIRNLERFRKKPFNEVVSFINNFYFDTNGTRLSEDETMVILGDELKNRLDNETHKRLFNLLCVAKLPKNPDDKLILDLNIKFDNGLSTYDFSEGEKKKILLQLILTILANKDTLILLDEPDSHIHVAHKKQIKEMIATSNIETILTTHSPSLMSGYENQLVFLDKGRIDGKEKSEILDEISGGTMSYTQRQILLNSNTDILIVEGKTDEKYISTALEKLKQENTKYRNLEFNYLYMGGSDSENLKKLVEQFPPKNNQTIIAFFDNDGAGFECIKNSFDCTAEKKDFIKQIENGIYICLYPKKEGFTKSDFEIEDYFKIETCRDFMFDNFETFQDTKKKFKKNEFAEHSLSLAIDEFDGFKILFDFILEIKGL